MLNTQGCYSDLTGLHNSISFKVKNTICMRVRSITKKNTIGRHGLELVQITLFQDKAFAPKHPEMPYLGWSFESQFIRSLLDESSKENAIGNMACGVDRFGQISPRSPMLIEHRPGHLNKGPTLALNNTILLRDIRRGKLMLEAQRSTKGFKMSILEFCTIVTLNRFHDILRELIL
jgi:hypothetical protein